MSVAQFNSSAEGLKALNDWLLTRSFCDEDGFSPSQTDVAVFKKLSAGLDAEKYPNVARWYRNIASYGSDIESFPGEVVEVGEDAPVQAAASKSGDDSDSDSDSDSDGDFEIVESSDDDDEDDSLLDEAEKKRRALQAEKDAKKAANAKSMVVFFIKPLEVSTDKEQTLKDQKHLEEAVRSIEMDGLQWQKDAGKFPFITEYIWKMQFGCIIYDAKVSVDLLSETIEELENGEIVQSIDIADFQKI